MKPQTPAGDDGGTNLFAVHEKSQGKGIAAALTEAMIDLADNWLQLRRLSLSVWVTDKAASGLYEKFGVGIEGTIRDYVFRQCDCVDGVLMSRLKTH